MIKIAIFIFSLGLLIFIFSKNFLPLKFNATSISQIVTHKDPLTIEAMRQQSYPGSSLKIEQTLADRSNYHQYIVSYQSAGLKVYGLLTVPKQDSAVLSRESKKYPVIVFNHGYIPPTQYKTTERYTSYVDAFASAGYVVFKSDYRGNGDSEGTPEGAYYSPAYTEDVLNAVSSLKKYPNADPDKIGMWGHSLGGNITLRSLVIDLQDIKAAVIWSGVVGTYDDLINHWQHQVTYSPPPNEVMLRNRNRTNLIKKYGSLDKNPDFWHSIDPNFYLQDITAPIQLHAGLSDEEVPWQFSQGLYNRLKEAGKTVEFYTYLGANHNISEPSFDLAIQRSVDFFNEYLKGGEKSK